MTPLVRNCSDDATDGAQGFLFLHLYISIGIVLSKCINLR